ncbi:MAG: hypothetical protein HY867_01780 [Chloroflexi bacterium]|nr:hypothetical protein [Chloroflexota bacterium]
MTLHQKPVWKLPLICGRNSIEMQKMKRTTPIILILATFLIVNCSPQLTVDSVTATATSQPAITMTPDITIHPTLASPLVLQQSDEIKAKLFSLLKNNGGCQLPCLLGNTPERTTKQEIQNFFSQFGLLDTDEMRILRGDSYTDRVSWAHFFFPYSTNTYLTLGVTARYEEDQIEGIGMETFSQLHSDDSWILTWNSSYTDLMAYYLLPQILTSYGRPFQIFVKTIPDDPQHPDVSFNSLYLVLFYPDQGFYLKYDMKRVIVDDKYVGCPAKSFVDIIVWSPDNKDGFKKWTEPYYFGDYKSVAEATSLSGDEFYETFKEQSIGCIETPLEVWANQ